MVLQILFLIIAAAAITLFSLNVRKIIRNINLGRPEDRSDRPSERLAVMMKVAFGQSKMAKRPIAFILHLFVYIGFVVINLEVLEIIIDGIFGTHRIFAEPLGSLYNVLIASFEVLAALVLLGVIVFFARRNITPIKRFNGTEMGKWPKSDANIILIVEVLLMGAFLTMNAADSKLQQMGASNYLSAGSFPVSNFLVPLLPDSESILIAIERTCWWFHIIGIFAFLNYLPYSKHLHIILAFPNTYYSNLEPKGELTNMTSVSNEVKAILNEIIEELYLEFHNDWLKTFNEKYLLEYDR
jgi:hypothetical protein